MNLGSEEKIMLIAHVEALFAERCIGVGTQEFIDIRRGKNLETLGVKKLMRASWSEINTSGEKTRISLKKGRVPKIAKLFS